MIINEVTSSIDITDPKAIAGHVWSQIEAEAKRGYSDNVEGQCDTVTVHGLEFAVGHDPNEDGILWALNGLDEDGTTEMVANGCWALDDRGTAEREIADVIREMNAATPVPLAAPATAAQLADAVFEALTVEAQDYFEQPDGVQVIKMNGWSLRIFDTADENAPHGISWWIDSPEERGAVEDGWEILPTDRIAAEAVTLAGHIKRRSCA
jgi:hypothetical protein